MKNAISLDSVKNFIEASVLNAIDNELLNFDFDRLKFEVIKDIGRDSNGLDVDIYKARISYLAEVGKEKGFNCALAAPITESRREALRHMVGVTVELLNELKKHSSRPVLTVIEGGKID